MYWGLLGASFLVVVVFLAIAGVEKVVYQFLFGRKASLRIECEAVGIIAWGCIDKLNSISVERPRIGELGALNVISTAATRNWWGLFWLIVHTSSPGLNFVEYSISQ